MNVKFYMISANADTFLVIPEGAEDFISWRNRYEEDLLQGSSQPYYRGSTETLRYLLDALHARRAAAESENKLLQSELAQERLAHNASLRAYVQLRRTLLAVPSVSVSRAPGANSSAPDSSKGEAELPPWRLHRSRNSEDWTDASWWSEGYASSQCHGAQCASNWR